MDSSSFVGGVGWDRAVVAQLAEILVLKLLLSTNGLDCQAALRHLRGDGAVSGHSTVV